jgi:[ribosomal protein S5]-alanine N-acetyltransferase
MATAPDTLRTARLVLRRPQLADVDAVWAYASDPRVTRYMSWATHTDRAETLAWFGGVVAGWDQGTGEMYLVCDPASGEVLGAAGCHRGTAYRAVLGYVYRPEAWGRGVATEACTALVALARTQGYARVEAGCHADHTASARVLEKSGLVFEGILRSYLVFPNLDPVHPADLRMYGLAL